MRNTLKPLPPIKYLPRIAEGIDIAKEQIEAFRPFGLRPRFEDRMPTRFHSAEYERLTWSYEAAGGLEIRCDLRFSRPDLRAYDVGKEDRPNVNGFVPGVQVGFPGTILDAAATHLFAAAFSAIAAFAAQVEATLRGRYDQWYAEACQWEGCEERRDHGSFYCAACTPKAEARDRQRDRELAEQNAEKALRAEVRKINGRVWTVPKNALPFRASVPGAFSVSSEKWADLLLIFNAKAEELGLTAAPDSSAKEARHA